MTPALELVTEALSSIDDPLRDIELTHDEGAWWSVVTARDGSVLWRFVCERSVWRLEAAPNWAPEDSFDADLLARHLLGHDVGDLEPGLDEVIDTSVQHLVSELQLLRRPVIEAFRLDNWPELRAALVTKGHRRDFELFGRPFPREPQ